MKQILTFLIAIIINSIVLGQLQNDPDIIAFYPFDGNGNDISTNSFDATLVGPSIFTNDRFGNPNSAFRFNGSDNYFLVNNVNATFKPNTFPITVSAWMRIPPDFTGSFTFLKNDFMLDRYSGLRFVVIASGQITANIENGGPIGVQSRRTKTGLTNIKDAQWHLITCIIRGFNDMDIFIDCQNDGGSYSGGAQNLFYNPNNPGIMGAFHSVIGAANLNYSKGDIDQLIFIKRELTLNEIKNLYSGSVAEITGNTSFCKGSSTVLTATGGTNYLWDNNSTNPIREIFESGTYSVTITGPDQCDQILEITVTSPSAEILGLTIFCEGDSILLYAQEGYSEYLWSNGASTESTYVYGGETSLIVTDANGCKDTTTVILEPIPNPTANFNENPENSVFLGDSTIFIDLSTNPNNIPITAWQWIFGDGEESDMQNPDHLYLEPGTYNISLIVTNLYGCKDTIEIAYHVLEEKEDPVVPNVFTPNGDGINDFFEISNIQHNNDVKFVVFNRWGKIIYESSNYDNSWDGNGNADGIYFYILEIPNMNSYKGFLTIIRD
jgi:gliding motility-associated-like protein